MKYQITVADAELERRADESLAEARLRAGKTVRVMVAAGLVKELAKLGLSEAEILAALTDVHGKLDAERLVDRLERANVVH